MPNHTVPTHLKKLAGNPGKRPLPANEPTPTRGYPACPDHLCPEAKAEWLRICDELDQMGLLSTADRTALSLYCTTWARWIEAEKQVQEHGVVLMKKGAKTGNKNPWLAIANNCHAQLLKIICEYGLTPASRTKVHVLDNKNNDDDFFEVETR